MNPLFTDQSDPKNSENSYILPRAKNQIKPLTHTDNTAVEMIRRKLDAMYQHEPDVKQEVKIVEHTTYRPRSKHQEFLYRLTASGRPMAEIQAAWHEYYAKLTDREKHEVWQEFYRANAMQRTAQQKTSETQAASGHHSTTTREQHQPVVSTHEPVTPAPAKGRPKSVKNIKKEILERVQASHSAQLKAKQHLQSLAFGLGMGALALLIALFGVFNELVITPFIRPGNASATPIILNTDGPAPSSNPEVIIPKLNAQLPVIYGSTSLNEDAIQKALEEGVFHYPTTATPGQNGNVAIFGHSSNNIFNKGKYKFAFVLLRELEPGDIFYLTYEGKVYTYKVFTKKVVKPEEVWVLTSTEGKNATAALITCDPPGSTRHRLVVWGEQISPDPATNTATAEPSPELETQTLPGKPQNWLSRLNPFD
ncbi:class D sortase [Candidatus Saccharibacteria bacterium]|nr:class D sortase [Candidatus Saccharibacteria bacterium]